MKRTSIALGLLLASAAPLSAGDHSYRVALADICSTPAAAQTCRFSAPATRQRFEASASPYASALRLHAGYSSNYLFEAFDLHGGFIDVVGADMGDQRGWTLEQLLDVRSLLGSDGDTGEARTGQAYEAPTAETIDSALKALLAKREELAATHNTSADSDAGQGASAAPTVVTQAKIDAALAELLAVRASWGTSPWDTKTTTAAAAVLPTDLNDLLAMRESWGTGREAKVVKAPLAAGAVSPLPKKAPTETASTRRTADVIINPLQTKPALELRPVAPQKVDQALSDLLSTRLAWASTAQAAPAAAADGYEELTTLSLDGLLAQRAKWGKGDGSRIMLVPLAAGAVSPLPMDAPPVGDATPAAEPIINPVVIAPVAKPIAVARTDINSALSALLAERESWGTAPSGAASGVTTASVADYEILTTTTLDDLLAQRAKWGTGGAANAGDCQAKLTAITGTGVIRFRSGSSSLDQRSNETLGKLAEAAKGCAGLMIRVEGHTDSTGSASLNQKLSEERAKSVAAFLKDAGVPSGQLEAVGLGETKPLVSNTTAANRAKNRRIEFSVK